MVSFFISILVFIGLPIIPIRKAYKEQTAMAELIDETDDIESYWIERFYSLQQKAIPYLYPKSWTK